MEDLLQEPREPDCSLVLEPDGDPVAFWYRDMCDVPGFTTSTTVEPRSFLAPLLFDSMVTALLLHPHSHLFVLGVYANGWLPNRELALDALELGRQNLWWYGTGGTGQLPCRSCDVMMTELSDLPYKHITHLSFCKDCFFKEPGRCRQPRFHQRYIAMVPGKETTIVYRGDLKHEAREAMKDSENAVLLDVWSGTFVPREEWN